MEDDTEPAAMATTSQGVQASEHMASGPQPEPVPATSSMDMDISEDHEDKAEESPKQRLKIILRYNAKSEKARTALRSDSKEMATEEDACHSTTQTSGHHTQQAKPASTQHSDSSSKSPSEETTSRETGVAATDQNTAEGETKIEKKPDGQTTEKELGSKVSSKRAATETPHGIINDERELKKARVEPLESMGVNDDTEMTGLDSLGGQQEVCDLQPKNIEVEKQMRTHTIEAQNQAEDNKTEPPDVENCIKNAPTGVIVEKEPDTKMTEADLQHGPEYIDDQRDLGTAENGIRVDQARVDVSIRNDSNTGGAEMDTSDHPERIDKQRSLNSTRDERSAIRLRVQSGVNKKSARGLPNPKQTQTIDSDRPEQANLQRVGSGPFNFKAKNAQEQFRFFKNAADPSCSKEQANLDVKEIKKARARWSNKNEWIADDTKWANRKLTVSLFNAQLIGVSFMKELEEQGNGGILADQMGFGKTAQIIALVVSVPPPKQEKPERKQKPQPCTKRKEVARKNAGTNSDDDDDSDYDDDNGEDTDGEEDDLCRQSDCTLIVGPPRSSKQLYNECQRFVKSGSKINTLAYARKLEKEGVKVDTYEKADFIITTYGEVVAAYNILLGLLRYYELTLEDDWQRELKQAGEELPALFAIKFWRVVLDESHQIRNPKTLRSQACHALQREKTWCVSGTPYINSIYDFYSQMKFAGDENSKDRATFKEAYGGAGEDDSISYDDKFGHLMIRRTTRDKLFGHHILPEIDIERFVRRITLSHDEKILIELIKSIFDDWAEESKQSETPRYGLPLLRLLRLRQTISSPFMLESFMARSFTRKALRNIKLKHADLKLETDMLPNLSRELGLARTTPERNDQPLVSTSSSSSGEGEFGDLIDVSLLFKQNICGICTGRCTDKQFLKCDHVYCKACIFPNPTQDGEEIPSPYCPGCKKHAPLVQQQEHDLENEAFQTDDDEKEDNDKDSYWVSAAKEINKNSKPKSRKTKGEVEKPPETRPGYDYRSFHPVLDATETRWLQQADRTKNQALLRRGKIGPCADLCQQITKDYPGDKIIAFTQFTQEAALVSRVLQHLGIPYIYINGQMTRKQMDDALKEMAENPKIKVMVTALKCGGESLNCQFANHAILIDPYWNVALEEQAVGRISRLGQMKKVYVYRLVADGTADDEVSKIQERKKEEAQKLIGDVPADYFELTKDELKAALK
ncbi:hypothetical protein LQW54_003361 [Pestalotiopsis sp. IQ-011]